MPKPFSPPHHGGGSSPDSPMGWTETAYTSASHPTAPISSKAEELHGNETSMVAHSQAGAKASMRKLSQEKRGCCWHLGARQRQKATCPLSGIASSPSFPACSQLCPPGHPQDHTQPNVHLHLAGGGPGKFLEGSSPRRGVWSQLLTCPEPLPALSIPHTCSAVPGWGSPPQGPHPVVLQGKDALKAAWLLAKVLKEIIACIKIFPPAKGLKPFP